MALALTEEHVALAESVRGWAGHTAPPPVIRSGLAAEDHGAALYRDTLRPGLAAQLFGDHGEFGQAVALAAQRLGQVQAEQPLGREAGPQRVPVQGGAVILGCQP